MNPGEIWHITTPEIDPKNPSRKHWAVITTRVGNRIQALWLTTKPGSKPAAFFCAEDFPNDFQNTKLKTGTYLLDLPFEGEIDVDVQGKFSGYVCGEILKAVETAWGEKLKLHETHPSISKKSGEKQSHSRHQR